MEMTIKFYLRYATYVVYLGGEALGSIRPSWHRARHVDVLPVPLVLALFVKAVEDPGAEGDVHPLSYEQRNRDRVEADSYVLLGQADLVTVTSFQLKP